MLPPLGGDAGSEPSVRVLGRIGTNLPEGLAETELVRSDCERLGPRPDGVAIAGCWNAPCDELSLGNACPLLVGDIDPTILNDALPKLGDGLDLELEWCAALMSMGCRINSGLLRMGVAMLVVAARGRLVTRRDYDSKR